MTPHSPLPTPHLQPLAIVGASTRAAAHQPCEPDSNRSPPTSSPTPTSATSLPPPAFRPTPTASSTGSARSSHRLGCTPARSKTTPNSSTNWPGSPRCGATQATCSHASGHRGNWPRHFAPAAFYSPKRRSSADGLPRDGSWLTKTYSGASGSGVRQNSGETRRSTETFTTHCSCLPSPSPLPLLQKRILGTPAPPYSSRSTTLPILEGVTRQLIGESWLGAHRFQYAGSIGLLPISETAWKTIERIGTRSDATF